MSVWPIGDMQETSQSALNSEYLEKQASGTLLEIIVSSLSIGRDLSAKLSTFNFSNVAMCLLIALNNL